MREAETDVPVLTKSVERSEGTASYAARRLTTRDLAWADVVGAMESRHVEMICRYWPHHAGIVVVLGVFDLFLPEEAELWEGAGIEVTDALGAVRSQGRPELIRFSLGEKDEDTQI